MLGTVAHCPECGTSGVTYRDQRGFVPDARLLGVGRDTELGPCPGCGVHRVAVSLASIGLVRGDQVESVFRVQDVSGKISHFAAPLRRVEVQP